MRKSNGGQTINITENSNSSNKKPVLGGNNNTALQHSETNEEEYSFRISNTSDSHPGPPRLSSDRSSTNTPFWESTWDQSTPAPVDDSSPIAKSPWSSHLALPDPDQNYAYTGLMGSLVREEGHIYSLAASGELLYTGSDSKNIRVWKNQKEFAGFKSNSGLVKAIIISGEKIFTGHQDGKIRVWKVSAKNPSVHKRIGTLPTFKAYIKTSMKPSNYIEARKNRNVVWIKHFDAISSLSLSEDKNFLYSASWDRTIKVWRVSDSKCLESINAHDDAVNSVVSGFDGLVFSGSADGSVKAWRRELQGKGTKHFFSQTLLKQECAVTALAIDPTASVLYCGSSDGLVNFWEREKHLSHGGVLRGHKLAVLCLATAKNLVFSGSADTNICIWKKDEDTHVCLSVLSGHSGPVKCLAVEEDRGASRSKGEDQQWIVYSGSLDKSVKIWKVSAQPAHMQPQPEYQTETFPSLHSFSSKDSRVSQMRPC
ncbi:hypothetical protein M9H77_15718 [Catharanthus roseus]|uniref:Uncharacterized protein n=1 Tax=Catharanthus roseus TaxID=4058 RepID=A0ACC0AZT4_CATRO|nr:hypothetical protein M9H77_15718 [Catharanthus roseus]